MNPDGDVIHSWPNAQLPVPRSFPDPVKTIECDEPQASV